MLRVHRIPFSTNVERIAIACGLKGVAVEWVDHDPADRAPIRAVSGQDLVPVLETPAGDVLTDSPLILEWLDARYPEPPLIPGDPGDGRQVRAFATWFNDVWKAPPNALAAAPDDPRAPAWAEQLRACQAGFEALLAGRGFLFGNGPTLADVTAAPFLAFTTATPDPDDADPFHAVLLDHLPGDFPRMAAWLERMAALPRA